MTIDDAKAPASGNAMLLKLLIGALAIRWAYTIAMFTAMGDTGLMGVDSIDYLRHGHLFAEKMANHALSGWQWGGTHPYMMPLFTWLVALNVLIFGKMAAFGYVMMQGVIDTGTCWLTYHIARAADVRIAIPAVIAAALNPTQIVMAGLLYSDTPFVFFVALFLCGGMLWLTSVSLRGAVAVGIGLGGAMLCRPLLAAWAPTMVIFLAVVLLVRGRLHRKELGHLAVIVMLFVVCTAPIVLRHAAQFGSWSPTPQTGLYLNRWIVPLVREAKDGTPWRQTYLEMQKRTVDRYGPTARNPFEQSKRYTDIALEQWRELGLMPTIKAWVFGAAINLGSPAIILSPPVLLMPKTGFYATQGQTKLEKIWNFLFRSSNGIYAFILLAGMMGLAAIRVIQIFGAAALATKAIDIAVLLMFTSWIGYILLVNGPIASPKYRLPIEPILNVLTGAGWASLTQRSRRASLA